MNKSICVIACLLSAKNVLAMENSVTKSNTSNLPSKTLGELYEEGGEVSVKLEIINFLRNQTSDYLNKASSDGESALEVALSEGKKDLFLFLLRNGANPELLNDDDESVVSQVANDDDFKDLLKRGQVINQLEEFVIKASCATEDTLGDIVSDFNILVNGEEKEIVEATKEANLANEISEFEKKKADKDSEELEVVENGDNFVEDTDERLSESDVIGALELLKDEALHKAQMIAYLQADFKGEKRQPIIQSGYGLKFVLAGILGGLGAGWLLFHSADDAAAN